ncbi:hypothetical protein L249_1971 [Ophiocordyceps polyrhachis-furcata BCC 54312]|uniref:Amine oxidase domain-containing protein n=1 Tax=Ophiocordyceps polyrhachis-furcata BCC 54312 TaxID=1330021 RepID=A0A367LNR1_9HYPO|nr:hypothetical protein L249_1971 [Ophiocordyceps polyrhachis-furcata BCC 54312]
MENFSVCHSSPRNTSSKIYQDLRSVRLASLPGLGRDHLLRKVAAMDFFAQPIKLLPQCKNNNDPMAKPHVAVVGAGLAGLRCAHVLQRHGFRVTVVEARNRIGGRLWQVKLANGHLVDVGPNWIHGTLDNPMHDLARQTKTVVGRWEPVSNVFDQTGSLFPPEDGEKYADVMWDIIQDAFKLSNKSCLDIHSAKSLYDYFHERVAERFPDTEPDSEHNKRVVLQLAETWGTFVGSPVSRQSLKFFWLEEIENLFCAGTYKKILDVVARPVLAESEVLFDTKVQRISCRGQQGEKTRLHVVDGDGQESVLAFDDVVVTCPLGWLKRNVEAFEPPLPPRLSQAIGAIGYGCLEKVYVSFPKAFWLSEDGDENQIRGFIQWLSPDYAPESNPDRWAQEAVELASLEPGSSHATLLFYLYGDQSRHVAEKLAALQTEAERDRFLADYFKPYYSRLPRYVESSADCRPSACLATAWVTDELAGFGSYSNFQVGLEEGDEDITTMRAGLPERGLWFAGEHTAPFVAIGTATGAYWSGESVGRRVAEAYGLASSSLQRKGE